MRDICKKRIIENQYNKEDTLSQNELLYKLKSTKNIKHDKDITIDLIEQLIYKRLKEPTEIKENTFKNKKKVWNLLVTIFSAISICLVILNYFWNNKSKFKNEPFKIYENLSHFSYYNIYGKKDLLDKIVLILDQMSTKIETCDEKILPSVLFPSEKNFLLYGEPGTGKTLFIKVFSYLYDLHIKIKNEIKKCGGVENFLKKKYTYEDLNKLPSSVVLITVQPSNLINKYIGDSEKNIERLFQYANENSVKKTVIIFIDEIDSLFSERKENTTEHASSIRSQFLSSLDGTETVLKSKFFVFGATNFEKNIDGAFIRRMGNHICFEVPNDEERLQIIKNFIKADLFEDQQKMKTLIDASRGMTPSNISTSFTELNRRKASESDTFSFEEIISVFNEYGKKKGEKLLMPIKIDSISDDLRKTIMYNRFDIPVPG